MPTTPRAKGFDPPEQIEEYRILRPLGQGAMGRVFLAHDTLLDRPVAIKFIAELDPLQLDQEGLGLRERFFIEARAIARLHHPNVVLVYRVGEWRGRPFLVSELVRGTSLDKLPLPVPWTRVLEIGLGLGRGLAAAHRQGVLHRDIKPANAMQTRDGELKLLDFGLAKLTTPSLAPAAQSLTAVPPLRESELAEAPTPPAAAELVATQAARLREAPRATTPAAAGPQKAVATTAPNPAAEATADTLLAISSSDLASSPGSLTQVGDVLGSPLYMAPELWRGEPATRQADIYALGTMLYELCAGQAPHDGVSLHELPGRVETLEIPSLATLVDGVDARFAGVIDRCLRRDPGERFASADALLEALDPLVERAPRSEYRDGNPYLGLLSFEARHSSLFFGRDAEVRAALNRLRAEPLLIVTGDSGVGKSSLCKAGVLVAIAAGALGPGHRIARLVPGRRPLLALAGALGPLLGRDEAQLAAELASAPHEVSRELCRTNRSARPPGRVVLFVDQLEELLTQNEPVEQEQVGRALRELCEVAPEVRVLATVRSDFLSRLAALPFLGPEVGRALFLLGPLGQKGLRESIERPAQAAGFRFESAALVEELAAAVDQTTGGLPLLQFTLSELWEARDRVRQLIPAQALERLGGLGGALAKHADGVLERMLPAPRQAARTLLGQLVTPDGTRARRARRELLKERDAAAAAALEALVHGRLLTVHASEDGQSEYEIAPAALLSSWDTLRSWLAVDAELRAARMRLGRAAAEWERFGQAPELLWQERQLAEVTMLPVRELPNRDAAFLTAARQTARRLRWRRRLAIGGVPVVLGLFLVAAQLRARSAIRQQVAVSLTQARVELQDARALNQKAEQARKEAFQLFDTRHKEPGERRWDEMLAIDQDARQAYRRASKEAEAAFMLDSKRPDVRDILASILFERALIAGRNHVLGSRDELLARVWLFDQDGSYRRRWSAPARLQISAEPPGTVVSLVPIDDDRHLQTAAQRELGTTPLSPIEVTPGNYLLIFQKPGRLEVRYPFLAQRGEELPVTVYLPQPQELPPGFLYIPAGRTLLGSDAEDGQRRDFLYHVPIHFTATDSFLIARYETTYGDWMAFLRALPAADRARHLPRAGQPGLAGAVALRELADGTFSLTLQPTKTAYTAREGELLHFTAAQRPPTLHWEKLPVTGVSTEDAEAYVKWLAKSGRVPGARLCTELEWERAARGADERHYPHADELLPADANFDQTYGHDPAAMGPDEVGAHPASRSLFGVDDLVGNAFEWVTGSLTDKPYALRGGAYYYGGRTCRIDNRSEAEPTMRNPTVGVRVCATLARQRP